jgi:hypothetical protein
VEAGGVKVSDQVTQLHQNRTYVRDIEKPIQRTFDTSGSLNIERTAISPPHPSEEAVLDTQHGTTLK